MGTERRPGVQCSSDFGVATLDRKWAGPGEFQEQKQERVEAEHSEGQGGENEGGDTCPTPTADSAESYNDVGQCKG